MIRSFALHCARAGKVLAGWRAAIRLAAFAAAIIPTLPAPAAPPPRSDPPWRIESFCHRPLPAAQRCLVRARQGILTFRIAELPAPPRITWRDGIAALRSVSAGTASLRFYAPPQTVSTAYRNVLDYDTASRLVAVAAGDGVQLRRMFAPSAAPPLATLATGGARPGSVQAQWQGRQLRVRWRDAGNRPVERSLDAPAR